MYVTAGIKVPATHFWSEAQGKRSYLGDPHGHEFEISVQAMVTDDNRQIEFHDLRDELNNQVLRLLQFDGDGNNPTFGSLSCEQIGKRLLDVMPQVHSVKVHEDEFCGATVTRVTEIIMPPRGRMAHNIITLCGSTRFKQETLKAARKLSAEGYIVEMVEFFSQADDITLSEEAKARVDQIHKDKIRSSHAIFVVNPGGYVGESTRSEIQLAIDMGLPIQWLEKPNEGTTLAMGLKRGPSVWP